MTTGEAIIQALQAYKVKQQRSGDYRCNSPLRPGSNSLAFTLKIAPDGESGAYHDHVSGESGSLYDLAKLLGIETPTTRRRKVEETKRTYSGLADYAQAHGAPARFL